MQKETGPGAANAPGPVFIGYLVAQGLAALAGLVYVLSADGIALALEGGIHLQLIRVMRIGFAFGVDETALTGSHHRAHTYASRVHYILETGAARVQIRHDAAFVRRVRPRHPNRIACRKQHGNRGSTPLLGLCAL